MQAYKTYPKIRNGRDYLASVQDNREVWLDGERMKNVVNHKAFQNSLKSIAQTYDLKNDPKFRDKILTESQGVEIPWYYKIPRSSEDLVRIRQCIELYSERVGGGFLDRLPEAGASALLPMLMSVRHELGNANPQYEENIEKFHAYCAENDLLLAFSRADPRGDRSKGPLEQNDPDLTLRIVEKTSSGIVVRGAKHTATPVPFAHEIVLLPGGVYRTVQEGPYAVCFSVPLETKGVKVVCRTPAAAGSDVFDSPLASRFDEIDGFIIFDDVFVPWERVFMGGEAHLTTGAWQNQEMRSWAGFNYMIKAAAKAKILIGASHLLSEWNGTNSFPATQDAVAELLMYMTNLRAHITAAELSPKTVADGIVMPNPEAVFSGRWYGIKNYHRMVNLVEDVCGVQMDVSPTRKDIDGALGDKVEKYFTWKGIKGRDRLKLLKLIGDLTVTRFAGHKELFQYYSEGVSFFNRMGLYVIYDFKDCVDAVKRLAQIE